MSANHQPDEGTNVAEEAGADADLAAEVRFDELGFEPAVSMTGDDSTPSPSPSAPATKRKPRRRSTLRRRISAFGILIGALGSMGGAYAAFASTSGAADSSDSAAMVSQGRQLYEVSCITCHGANLSGVQNQGPSLVGVGGAAAYFQVSTGRMPATGQGASIQRKTPKFNDEQTRALAAYVQSIGGGPAIPTGQLRGNAESIPLGGELFSQNCASCHGITFKGAPLSAGKTAPSLNASTNLQMITAMLSGPESMPVFSNNQLTPEDKKAIVAYVQTIKASNDPGGSGVDRIGPVSEAIVLWVGGVGLLMIAILWIGAKSQ
jgi:ubiquinol-cytochrome c reductase cytochrome c subunit